MRVIALVFVVVGCGISGNRLAGRPTSNQEQLAWAEFVRGLQSRPYPAQDIRPYDESLREPMAGFLAQMRAKADWREWQRAPRVFRTGEQAHFIIPLTFDRQRARYCFSFIRDGDEWHFQHLEAITLPFDQLGNLPVSEFPDLPEPEKARIREELEVSHDVRIFNTLAASGDTAAALNWFKDGNGYALAARAWIPYVPASEAFILYACWEQANLRGNKVVLERLDSDTAVVRIGVGYFRLYRSAAHLRQQISPERYRDLYETRWQNRATVAGWNLNLVCIADECAFRFTKASRK